MGRRIRKIVRVLKKRLPSIFLCPRCGKNSVRVITNEESRTATIDCGSCGLKDELAVKPAWAPVDAYSFWADKYYRSEIG
jgi:transcription elongation factor Elf1